MNVAKSMPCIIMWISALPDDLILIATATKNFIKYDLGIRANILVKMNKEAPLVL